SAKRAQNRHGRLKVACSSSLRWAERSNIFHLLGWIFFGLVVGVIAKFLMPGPDPRGFIVTIGLGIAGSVVGGFLARLVGSYGPPQQAGSLLSRFGALPVVWPFC